MDTFGLVAVVVLYCNSLASNSWRVAKILKLYFGSVLKLSRCSAVAVTHSIPKVVKQ